MFDNSFGIESVFIAGKRKAVIFVNLIVAVLYGLVVLAEIIIMIMRCGIRADIDSDKSGELNIHAVLYPIGIIALNAKSVLAYGFKLRRICHIFGCLGYLRSPSAEFVGVARSFGL